MLLEGGRVVHIADMVGLTPNAIYNMMQRPHFQRYYGRLLAASEQVAVNAHRRILQTQDLAIDTMLSLIAGAEDERVRLAAAQDWLDRGTHHTVEKGGEASERPTGAAFEHILGVLRELNTGESAELTISATKHNSSERKGRGDTPAHEGDVQEQLVLSLQGGPRI
jgi:hypothetical protein